MVGGPIYPPQRLEEFGATKPFGMELPAGIVNTVRPSRHAVEQLRTIQVGDAPPSPTLVHALSARGPLFPLGVREGEHVRNIRVHDLAAALPAVLHEPQDDLEHFCLRWN